VFPLRLDETSPLFKSLSSSRVHIHLSCFPAEGIEEFENYLADGSLDPQVLKAKERNESKR
jgi:hypothetical protein